jgi:hypothetical protein
VNSQVLVLYFGKREDNDEWFKQVDLAQMSAEELVLCLRAPKVDAPDAKTTDILPAAKLQTASLWQAYGVAKDDTFIVAEKYGNEFKRTDSRELAAGVNEVAAHFRALRKQMKEEVAAAQKSLDAGKAADALATLRTTFGKGLVGYPECATAESLYTKAMEAGRKELEQSKADSTKLKTLAKTWHGTQLAADIEKALKAAESTASKN